ncbi:MAG TPA: T9SS type A sorting domain-containing protein [Saprospiraceae bacterium]|nr:T9SS type A sorting domain-containing protein [Saprospiraceae bacterium]
MGQGTGPSCTAPIFTVSDHITTHSVRVQWIDFNSNPSGWEIEWGEIGFTRSLEPNAPLVTAKMITLDDLDPGKAFELWARTVCNNGNKSTWSGPFLVRTAIANEQDCQLNLDIKDNSCPRTEEFLLWVDEFPGMLLGKHTTIANVELIIEHSWPADLQIELESPGGKRIPLTTYRGIGMVNYGNPEDTTCTSTCSFSDESCLPVSQHTGSSLTGVFAPEQPLAELYDGTSVNGMWKLIVCDRAIDDIGLLKYFKIQFEPLICPIPLNLRITEISNNSASILWDPTLQCNNVIVSVVFAGQAPGSHLNFFTSCFNEGLLIQGLQPETSYEIFIQGDCGDKRSGYSCPVTFQTTCQKVTLSESFDLFEPCDNNCLSICPYEFNGWYNVEEDDQDWLVNNGPTLSALTGPDSDISGNGNYIYIVNSPEICGVNNKAILESRCIEIPPSDDNCDMSFYYHMFGDGIESLSLLISTDGGSEWHELFSKAGNQENEWQRQILDLSTYTGQLAIFRFIGITSNNQRGDIALDQIDFFGAKIISDLPIYFADLDGDGFGDANNFLAICMMEPPQGYVENDGDCDDTNPDIHPDAEEIPCNLIDENCNGMIDDHPLDNPIIAQVVSLKNESCPQAGDASISLSITGGTAPYQVTWNNGMSGQQIENLHAGMYFAEIKDASSCLSISPSIMINISNSPNIFIREVKNTLCAQQTGFIDIDVTGGNPPYNYQWSNGKNSQDLTQIGEGKYSVTVTDQSGCSVESGQINIEATPRFTAGIQLKREPICHGASNGLISIGIINALPPVQYSWNTGQSTSILQGLKAGKYSVTINDARGCVQIINTELKDPPSLSLSVVGIKGATCFNESSGAIQMNTSGGTAPYEFTWSSPDHLFFAQNIHTEDIVNIPPGRYQLFVKDAKGCTAQSPLIHVENASSIQIKLDSTKKASCRLSEDGFISVNVTGGGGDFVYFWNNTEGPPYLENVLTGTYSMRVIDRFGCKASNDNIKVDLANIPVHVSTSLLQTNECARDSFAAIMALANTTKMPVDFNWSNGKQRIKNSNRDSIFFLPSGNYNVTITDGEGCVGTSAFTNIQAIPELIIAQIQPTMNRCNSDKNGQIQVQIQGGTPPYRYLWSDGQTTQNALNLPVGNYILTVTDNNDCMIKSQSIAVIATHPITTQIKVNPATGDQKNGSIELNVAGGTPPYRIDWQDLPDGPQIRTNLASGSYCLTITDNNGCYATQCPVVDQTTSTFNPATISPAIISPNPFSSQIRIQAIEPILNVSIFDVNGYEVYQLTGNFNDENIELENLISGIYFVRLQFHNKSLTRKIVKIK